MGTNSETKRIGDISLDYSKYKGKDIYLDGNIEDDLLEICKLGKEKETLLNNNKWPILYHLSDIRENVIDWYTFKKDAEVLEIGSGCGSITGVLSKKSKTVTCIELSERRSMINAYRHKNCNNVTIKLGNFQDIEPDLGKYDYITLIGVLEYSKLYIKSDKPYLEMLLIAKKHLKKDGKLIIAIENKMGIKYLNGAPEDHTGLLYSGINDYIYDDSVRTFSKEELKQMLIDSGYEEASFYYPIPDYKLPSIIYSSENQPSPGQIRTYKKNYQKTRIYNFMEDVFTDQLCNDGMYGYMSNSFVIIAGETSDNSIVSAKYNRERLEKFRIATVIENTEEGKRARKKALNSLAQNHIRAMAENAKIFSGNLRNIICVNGFLSNDEYISDYIEGKSLEETLYSYRNSPDLFITQVKKYIDEYLIPDSKQLIKFVKTDEFINVFGDNDIKDTLSMKVSNVDIIFSNLKEGLDGKIYAFDFEWVYTFPIPYRYLLWRPANEAYYTYQAYLKTKININQYFMQLGFEKEEIKIFQNMEKNFGFYVAGNNWVEEYTKNYVKPAIMFETKYC